MYSPVMDAITFRFLMSLTASKNLEMHLMDVVTAYLYGSLDNDIYMKLPEGLKMPGARKIQGDLFGQVTAITLRIIAIRTHVVQSLK